MLAFGHILQVCAERIRSKSLEDMTEQQLLEEDPEAIIFGAVQWHRAKRIDSCRDVHKRLALKIFFHGQQKHMKIIEESENWR